MEGGKKKNWIPPKKKWKCSASWWALRSQASSVFKTEVWLPPAARHKNNCLHSQAGDKRANQLCVVYTIPYFDSETTLSLPPKSASFFYYWRAELLILQKKSRCMMQIPTLRRGLHADEGLNLFPFNRSVTIVCPPGLPFL